MNLKDATLLSVEKSVTRMSLVQMTPRTVHEIISGELARTLAGELKSKLAALYEVTSGGGLTAKYPAYSHLNDCGYEAVTYGVQLHVLSREDLKEIIAEESALLVKKHQHELVQAEMRFNARVTQEAKRLLEKASL